MKVFRHHIYEYRKGLRNLILHTMPQRYRGEAERLLHREGIAFETQLLRNGNMNIFFGADECVAVIKSFGRKRLRDYTPEEDFILGTMLGYGRLQQCTRFLKFKRKQPAGIGPDNTQGTRHELAI